MCALTHKAFMPQNRDMSKQTILDQVVAELERRVGELREVAEKCDLSYDTVLRIKNRENDPAFGKVQKLHDFLFPKATKRREAA